MAEFNFTITNVKTRFKDITDSTIDFKHSKNTKTGYTDIVIYNSAGNSVGGFSFICDAKNCGILHISGITAYHENWSNVFTLIDAIALALDRRILTYNTSSEQGHFKEVLERFKFKEISSAFKNPRSENTITFHLKKVKV